MTRMDLAWLFTLALGHGAPGLATQCPLASQIHHDGAAQKWRLDASYEHSYWQISSTRPADLSSLQTLPPEANLSVWLYPQNPHPLKVSCLYQMGEQWAVSVTHHRSFDPASIPLPPFTKSLVQGLDGFSCFTTAGDAAHCSW